MVILAAGMSFSGLYRCGKVAVVERLKQDSMSGLPAETKKVAVLKKCLTV